MAINCRHYVRTISVLSLLASCACPLWAQKPTKPKPRPVATFNGTPITDDELNKAASADLDHLRLQIQQMKASLAEAEHKILENNLIRLLADKMFEAEASKKGLTKEAFLEQALAGKVKEPSLQEISSFYEANKQRIDKPLDQVTDQIMQYLKTENRNRAIGDLADSLKAKAAKLKLDSMAFDYCLTSGKYAGRVKQDQRDGYSLGVTAAPAVFINGRFLSGAVPQSDLLNVIDEEIRISSSHKGGDAARAEGTYGSPSSARMP